ncbi:MAG: hypothetical protein ACYDCP_08755 [Thermoplasmataceae archaeon]
MERVNKIAENAKIDLIKETSTNIKSFETTSMWRLITSIVIVGAFLMYLAYLWEPKGLTLLKTLSTLLITFLKEFAPAVLILTAFYFTQLFSFKNKIDDSKEKWFSFFRKEGQDEYSADGVFLSIGKVKKSIEYGLTWIANFSKISRAYLDAQKIQFRVNDAKNLLINGLSTYGIYSDKYKDDIEKCIKINEDQSQAIQEITKEVWARQNGNEKPNKKPKMDKIFYFIYLERRNDPKKIVLLHEIIHDENTKKEFSNILLNRLTLKLDEPWTESIKEWIAMESLLLSESNFNLEGYTSKYDEIARSILALVRTFKTVAMKYGLVFESESLVKVKLPDKYDINGLRKLIAQNISRANSVDLDLIEMLEKLEESGNNSEESLESLKKNPHLLEKFYNFLIEYDVLISLIEFEDFSVIFSDFPNYSLEKLQYSCNTLASYINYHRGAIASLRQLNMSISQNNGMDTKKIKRLLKLNNTSEKQRLLYILGDITYDIVEWGAETNYICESLDPKILEECKRDYALFLVVLLVNFYRGNISTVSISTINRDSLDYEKLDYRLFNYMKSLEQNPTSNLLDLIRRAFINVFENRDDPNHPLFKDKLGLGQLPQYKELARERVRDAYKLISETKLFDERVEKQGKLIKVFRRFMEYEISPKEINNLIRGGVVEAYLLNVGTEGGKTLTIMGGSELEVFGKFLDEHPQSTGDPFLKRKAFLMVRSAGRAARIGLIPPGMSFEKFSEYFNKGLTEFLFEKKANTSDVYLSRIFASEESFKNLLSEPNAEPTHLKIIREIISKNVPSEYVVSYLAATRQDKIPTHETIEDLITTVVNSKSGGYYGFNSEFFEQIHLPEESVFSIENNLKNQFKSDLFVKCCVKVANSISKNGMGVVSREIGKIVLANINSENIKRDNKSIQRVVQVFIDTSEFITEIFHGE